MKLLSKDVLRRNKKGARCGGTLLNCRRLRQDDGCKLKTCLSYVHSKFQARLDYMSQTNKCDNNSFPPKSQDKKAEKENGSDRKPEM